MHVAVLLLGTNAGNRVEKLAEAKSRMQELGSMRSTSAIYETAPWGNTDQPAFLNQVVVMETALSAPALMKSLLSIETAMGRIRLRKWEQRIIDIDLLFFNDAVIKEEGLTVPHPLLQKRRFTLAPLHEVMPAYIHPVLKKSIRELYIDCKDDSEVHLYEM